MECDCNASPSAVIATTLSRSVAYHVCSVEPGVVSTTCNHFVPATSSSCDRSVSCAGAATPHRTVICRLAVFCHTATPAGAGSAITARRSPITVVGMAAMKSPHSDESAAGEFTSAIATGVWYARSATTRAPMITPTTKSIANTRAIIIGTLLIPSFASCMEISVICGKTGPKVPQQYVILKTARMMFVTRIVKNPNPTLADVGEQAVITAIVAHAPSTRNGDDAAVLDHAAPNSRTVITTDTLVEGRHFRRDWSHPAEIGRKAITQNFADVEAMGARPIAALLALSAPGDTPLEFVADLARGINERVTDYDAELVGGDVTDNDRITIAVTGIGQLGGSLPPLRLDQARPGQILVASGHIGYSAAGYALLKEFGRTSVPAEFDPMLRAHCSTILTPGRGFVARSAGVTAMTDNSDGLVHDLYVMAKKSAVTINLDSAALQPDDLLVQAAELVGADPWEFILSGGEDHTLIGTTFGPPPTGFVEIGTVVRHNSMGAVTLDRAAPPYTYGWESY